MRKFILLLCLAGLASIAPAADTVFVKEAQVPVLLERQDNVMFYLRIPARESRVLDQVVLDFSRCADWASVAAVKLYYGGVEARQDEGKNRFAPVGYISSFSAGKTLSAYPSYSVKCAEVTRPDKRVVLQADYELYPGVNFFWVSLQMKPGTSLSAKVGAELASVAPRSRRRSVPSWPRYRSTVKKPCAIGFRPTVSCTAWVSGCVMPATTEQRLSAFPGW